MFLQIKALFKTALGIILGSIILILAVVFAWKWHQTTKLRAQVEDLQGQLKQAQANEKVLQSGIDQQNSAVESMKKATAEAASQVQDAQGKAAKTSAHYRGILAKIAITEPPKEAGDALTWATDEAARIQEGVK